MKYEVFTDRQFNKILKRNGYVVSRTNGDHTIWYNESRKDNVTISKNLNPIVAQRLIKEHKLKGE